MPLRISRILVGHCNHVISRGGRYEREVKERSHTLNGFVVFIDDSFRGCSFSTPPSFVKKKLLCNSSYFIQHIFIEHLVCDRLCIRCADYSNGQNKASALVEPAWQ